MNFGKEFEKYAVKHKGISSNTLDAYLKHNVTNLTPNIIEERPMNIAVMDVYSRLMMDRIIFLGYPISDEVANIVTAQLLFLESTDRTRDIQMYINCPGGGVYAGLGMYDTMQFITPDIATICTGMAASMGAVLMCAGAKGKRTALKHDLPEQTVNELLAYFLALKGESGQEREFRERFDVMALQRNLKALGTFGLETTARRNPVYIQYIPRTLVTSGTTWTTSRNTHGSASCCPGWWTSSSSHGFHGYLRFSCLFPTDLTGSARIRIKTEDL